MGHLNRSSLPSKRVRIAQVLSAVISCFFAAGVVFGFAALKPVLLSEGAYRDRCTAQELEDNVPVCLGQELALNFIFTCAAVVTNCCALPVGFMLDRIGPRWSTLLGSVFLTAGCLLLAFASVLQPILDGYLFGYISLAASGPLIFITSLHLSNAFPTHSGLVLSMLTGAFDASSGIFLGYRVIYTATKAIIGPRVYFLVYLLVPLFISASQICIMPKESYKTLGEMVDEAEQHITEEEIVGDDDLSESDLTDRQRLRRESAVSEVTSLLGGSKIFADQQKKEEAVRSISGVWGAMHGRAVAQQIKSPWWILITLFTMVQMLRLNYFIATIRTQYTFLFDGDASKAVHVNEFFDVALPLAGLVGIPFVGYLLDHTSTRDMIGLLVISTTIIGVLGIIPKLLWPAYINIALFVLYRPLFYTAVSDYCAKVFGFQTFGTVYGLLNSLCGVFNLGQTILDRGTHFIFHGNPIPLNVALLLLGAGVGAILWGYISKETRRRRLRLRVRSDNEEGPQQVN